MLTSYTSPQYIYKNIFQAIFPAENFGQEPALAEFFEFYAALVKSL